MRCKLEHVDRFFSNHSAQLVIRINHASIVCILKLVLLNVDPHFLDNLRTCECFCSNNCLKRLRDAVGHLCEPAASSFSSAFLLYFSNGFFSFRRFCFSLFCHGIVPCCGCTKISYNSSRRFLAKFLTFVTNLGNWLTSDVIFFQN